MTTEIDDEYYNRVQAMEYAVKHDDGNRPVGLIHADVVLVGISRTSKTPISIYLGYRGVRVANIPLALEVEPPSQLFDVDPRRVFGLVTTPEVLKKVRTARLKEFGTAVPGYADSEQIERELEMSRQLMRRLGCVVVNTADRAIEDVAHEIISYLHDAGLPGAPNVPESE
jgi:regulator of PEP synthase PpsR (kinase-PPPase family)